MQADLENSAVVTGLEKVSFHFNSKEVESQRMLKLLYNCAHFTCQQHHAQNPSRSTSEVCEFQDSEIKLPTFVVSCRKQGNSGKTSTSASLTMLKPLTLWITTNCGKSLKTWEYQTTSLVS